MNLRYKIIIFITILAAFFSIIYFYYDPPPPPPIPVSCQVNVGNISRGDTYYNITILLDLSNRIAYNNQSEKDIEIIKTTLDLFQGAQIGFGYQMSKDRINVEICKQRTDSVVLNVNPNNLFIDMDRDNSPKMNFPYFCNQKDSFINTIEKVYHYSNTTQSFYGADVWSFFQDEISRCIKFDNEDSKFKNKLIILTDGYLNFDPMIQMVRPRGTYMYGFHRLRNQSNWKHIFMNRNYKLTPHTRDFHNLEVLLLELDPKDPTVNTNEMEILTHFWKTWFDDMKIPSKVYGKSNSVKNITPVLKDFLFN